MHLAHERRPRARSPFAAAFLSLLFPGLGHAYAGAPHRALAFAAPPLLLLALGAGVAIRLPRAQLIGFFALSEVLTAIFILNLLLFAYRVAAVLDAYRVTHYLNAWKATGGRLGRPRVAPHPLSVAGLLAVILVMSGAHVAVARYDMIVMQTADCVFNPDLPCGDASPTPLASDDEPTQPPDDPEPSYTLPPVGSALPDQTIPPWNGRERLNILLIGADEQGGGHNTDTLITVSVDPVTRQVAMFTLPRDTVNVPIPAGPARDVLGSAYRRKINSLFLTLQDRPDLFPGGERTRAYNGLKAVLGELYGLDIKYFVEVNFDGFIKVIDALGGVSVNVQVPVVDDRFPSEQGLRRIYIPAGVQRMSGEEALVYARSRNASNDFDRGQRQQRILLSLARQTDPSSILPRINALSAALATAVRTDIPRDLLDELLGLAERVDLATIRSYVFASPGYATEVTEPVYVLIPDVEKIRATVRDAFTVDPELAERREALGAEAGRVWVVNGSEQAGQAAQLAAYLEYLGMTASSPSTRPDETSSATRLVVYNGAEERLPVTVATLEDVLGVEAELESDPAARVDIIVTTGTTTPQLTPPPAP